MDSRQQPDDLVSVPAAARAAGVTTARVTAWIRQGFLPTWPAGRRTLVGLTAVCALAQQHGVDTIDEAVERESETRGTQPAPSDLVSVREAAEAVGMSTAAFYDWINAGSLVAYGDRASRRVSLAAVRVLLAPPDLETPTDAMPIGEVARQLGMSRHLIHGWAKRGEVPSWQGRYGKLVRVADVQAVALQRVLRVIVNGEERTPL